MVRRKQDDDTGDDAQLHDELSTVCHLRQYETGFSVEIGSGNSTGGGSLEGRCSFHSSGGSRDSYTGQGHSLEVSEAMSPVPLSGNGACCTTFKNVVAICQLHREGRSRRSYVRRNPSSLPLSDTKYICFSRKHTYNITHGFAKPRCFLRAAYVC